MAEGVRETRDEAAVLAAAARGVLGPKGKGNQDNKIRPPYALANRLCRGRSYGGRHIGDRTAPTSQAQHPCPRHARSSWSKKVPGRRPSWRGGV